VSIPGTSTRRPVAVAMLFLAVILLGAISFVRLPIDLLPDVSYPRLVIYTSYPDVAPTEVERVISERVEQQVAAVPGVERVTSVSRDGVSLVTAFFAWGTDMDFAMLNTRERLDNLRDVLPETSERPRILRVDPESEPIMVLSVAGGTDLWQTRQLAETVFRRRLEQLDGVAQAALSGGLEREIHVDVNPRLLQAYGVELQEVSNALAAANYSAPGGFILRGRFRYPLRTLGEFQEVEQIGDVVVARQATGTGEGEGAGFRLVRIRDVAAVEDGFKDRETVARYNGKESVGLLVFKESGANTVGVADLVVETLEVLKREYPGIEVQVASSQAGFIDDSISNVVSALVFGGMLAFLVLFFFLRDPRYPVAIALAIPISVVGTFALMEAAGVSLNIMSLGGLALGVGMLVDNSIVVLENVFRHREAGESGVRAATLGAEEVQGAITASTLTTISVFLPIIYVEGVAGQLFRDLSLAVAFSLLTSLVVALTLLPTMAARFSSGPREDDPVPEEKVRPTGWWQRSKWLVGGTMKLPFRLIGSVIVMTRDLIVFWAGLLGRLIARVFTPLLDAFDVVFSAFAARYHTALEWSLDRRAVVMVLSFATLGGSLALGTVLDRDLLPSVDQGAFEAHLELGEGTGIETTRDVAKEIEARFLADPGVAAVFTQIGRDVRAYAQGDDGTGLNTAKLDVRLKEDVSTDQVLERVRSVADGIPSGTLTLEAGQATALGQVLGGTEADIAVRIRAEDLTAAYQRAELVRDRLHGLAALSNVRIGMEQGTPELMIDIDRDASARYGVEPRLIAEEIDRAMRGDPATEFVDFDRKIDIVVRFPDDLRYSRETLNGIRVRGVPLRELIRVREVMAPSEVFREEQSRVITVYADVIEGGLDRAIVSVQTALSDLPPTRLMRMDVGGENEEMRRSFRDLAFAFGLALILVYMILAAQFESFVHPFTILMAVPLALIGAIAALVISGQGLNTMSLIGVVILVGIVVNDSIVKVDFINQARQKGMELRPAILEAGRVRLRPIIMTTVTTVLGLLPMAFGLGRGADLRAPLAIAVIGGLLVATALTLIVVPVVYSLVESVRTWARGEGEAYQ
jgi:hydrophobic/amphiphilic exporter-1 (mainly G- bacteria), HAE1 family